MGDLAMNEAFEQLVGRGPSVEALLRETTEQILTIMREKNDPACWTYPALGQMVWDSFDENDQVFILGRLLDVYIEKVYQDMAMHALPSLTGPRRTTI
jgi:hypothetical protein